MSHTSHTTLGRFVVIMALTTDYTLLDSKLTDMGWPFFKNCLIFENLSLERIFASNYINKLMVMKYKEDLLLKFLIPMRVF